MLVVGEDCGSAPHWAHWLNTLGIEVRQSPAQCVSAYVGRYETDPTGCSRPIRVKSACTTSARSVWACAQRASRPARPLEVGIAQVERELAIVARHSPCCHHFR